MLSKLKLPWALFLGLTLLFAYSCDNDDDTIINEDESIMEVLSADSNFTTLVGALERVGLDDELSDQGRDFTLFAPDNDAFAAVGADLATMTDDEVEEILLYHLFTDDILSSQIQEGKTYLNTAADTGPDDTQLTLLIGRSGANITINDDATVTEADRTTENGVIHEIDAVLMPLDVVGHLQANDDFSELVTALGNATGNLVDSLGDLSETYTIFAPTDNAFDAASTAIAGLTADELTSVLAYHVVGGSNLTASMLSDGQMVSTEQGEDITIDIDGNNVSIVDSQGNSANVLLLNVQGTNGVVHIIDKVIMPNDL